MNQISGDRWFLSCKVLRDVGSNVGLGVLVTNVDGKSGHVSFQSNMGEVTMKYSANVFTGEKNGFISQIIVSEMERHFNIWMAEEAGSTFTFRWIKNALLFETNSDYLIGKWLTTEIQFINYMLQILQVEETQKLMLSNAA